MIEGLLNTEKELIKKVIRDNDVIEIMKNTEELYTEYTFWEGNKEDLIKAKCIANYLPYYVCVIQPKENIPSTIYSRKLLLLFALNEIKERLERVWKALQLGNLDRDELFSKGNTIRNILEFALKHFCVMLNIPIDIESKYGYIELGQMKKAIKSSVKIDIT